MPAAKQSVVQHLATFVRRHPPLYSLSKPVRVTLNALNRAQREGQKRQRYEESMRYVHAVEQQVQQIESQFPTDKAPVAFFAPSVAIGTFNYNASVGLLATWALRMTGQPVTYLVCNSGMSLCIAGTVPENVKTPLPCDVCIAHSGRFYPAQHSIPIPSFDTQNLYARLQQMNIDELMDFELDGVAFGKLCVPAARWILRRRKLDSDVGRDILAQYIASSVSLARRFDQLFTAQRPSALMVFNGSFYPEATARTIALKHNIPVLTYEIGYRPISSFFTHGVATGFEVDIPNSFQMGAEEDSQLNALLSKRTTGDFDMAGVRFWQEMKSISPELQAKIAAHRQVVTVFTNVIFDTSQTNADTVFESMFDWIDGTMKLAKQHPETLFIVRAHPDELRGKRPATESVTDLMHGRGYIEMPNVAFIPSQEFISSYELLSLSKFCIVYNSTIGMEATILGVPVVMGAYGKYSSENFTYMPPTPDAYHQQIHTLLTDGVPPLSDEWRQRARRCMYYMVFRVSLDMSPFIDQAGFFKPISAAAVHPDHSRAMAVVRDGIVNRAAFRY